MSEADHSTTVVCAVEGPAFPPEAPPIRAPCIASETWGPATRSPPPPCSKLVTIIPSPQPAHRTQASVLLDLVRGLAAVLVLLEHWRNFLFVDFPQLPAAHRLWLAAPYLLCSAGHQAVVIFFIMSGYLIAGSIFRLLERGRWHWPTYLLHRLLRLWVVLLPGLFLCLAWDRLGLALHRAPALYGGAFYNHMTPPVATLLTPAIFAGNAAFLQGITVPQFGSDGALWSLANEFWYYLLFPLGLLALYRSPRQKIALPARLLCAALFLAAAWLLRHSVLPMFPVWLAGALLCKLPSLRLGNPARTCLALAFVPVFFYFARGNPRLPFNPDYALAFVTTLFFWVLLSAHQPARPSSGTRASHELARFSYTLYVVHMPLLLFLTALLAHDTRWLPGPSHLLAALALLGLTLLYAYAIATLTEFRTDRLRHWLEAKLHLGNPGKA